MNGPAETKSSSIDMPNTPGKTPSSNSAKLAERLARTQGSFT